MSENPASLFVPSHGIVVVQFGIPHLVYYQGTCLRYWLEVMGADETARDMIEEDTQDGVYTWSGEVQGHRDYWGEYDEELQCSEFRPVTKEEWEAFTRDEIVWDFEQERAYLNYEWEQERKHIDERYECQRCLAREYSAQTSFTSGLLLPWIEVDTAVLGSWLEINHAESLWTIEGDYYITELIGVPATGKDIARILCERGGTIRVFALQPRISSWELTSNIAVMMKSDTFFLSWDKTEIEWVMYRDATAEKACAEAEKEPTC